MFRQRAALVARYLKTVAGNVKGVWVGVGTPELSAIGSDTNTIVLWDELNAGLYGALYSQGGEVYAGYYDGPGATFTEAFHWGSGGLTAQPPAIQPLALTAAWYNYDPSRASWDTASYQMDSNSDVMLAGLIQSDSTPRTVSVIGYLPSFYRPRSGKHFLVYGNSSISGEGPAKLQVLADGTVQVIHPSGNACTWAFLSLDGVAFQATQ